MGAPCCLDPLMAHTQGGAATYKRRDGQEPGYLLTKYHPKPAVWPQTGSARVRPSLGQARGPSLVSFLSWGGSSCYPTWDRSPSAPRDIRGWGRLWLAASLLPDSSLQLCLHSHLCPGLLLVMNLCDISEGGLPGGRWAGRWEGEVLQAPYPHSPEMLICPHLQGLSEQDRVPEMR